MGDRTNFWFTGGKTHKFRELDSLWNNMSRNGIYISDYFHQDEFLFNINRAIRLHINYANE